MLRFQELDVEDAGQVDGAVALTTKVFGKDQEKMELVHRVIDSHPDSVLYAAFDRDRIVGINGFMAHSVCRNGEVSIAYQSCQSAIYAEYQGQGIFSHLMNRAKTELKRAGAAFLMGFPNSRSGPIMTDKLGFDSDDMDLIYLPGYLGKISARSLLDCDRLFEAHDKKSRVVLFDAHQCAAWKRKKYGSRLIETEYFNNYLFGTVTKRSGMKMLNVGGYEFHKPDLVPELIGKAAKQSGAQIIRFIVPKSSALAAAARFPKMGKDTEPLLTFPLNWDLTNNRFEAYTGIKDVY